MKLIAEIVVFATLAVMIHLALMLRPMADGPDASGAGGEALASFRASNQQIDQMVANWDRPVEPQTTLSAPVPPARPEVAEAPLVAALAPELPRMSKPAIALPTAPAGPSPLPDDMAQPEPEPEAHWSPPRKTAPAPRPARKNEPEPPPENAKTVGQTVERQSEGQKQQTAAGRGNGSAAGTTSQSSTGGLSAARRTSLVQSWGGKIRARIVRNKRAPRGNYGGVTVLLRLTITREGRVASASVARSSGLAALDQAALSAVRRSRRMPAAPRELTQASYNFNLPIVFE